MKALLIAVSIALVVALNTSFISLASSLHSANDYNSCLVVTIKKISIHQGGMYKSDNGLLNVIVQIDDVLREGQLYAGPERPGFQRGADVTFIFDDSNLLAPTYDECKKLVGVRTVWSIEWWRIEKGFYHVVDLFEPFRDHNFTAEDIRRLKMSLAAAPQKPLK